MSGCETCICNFDRLELVLIFQWVTVMALVIGLYFRT